MKRLAAIALLAIALAPNAAKAAEDRTSLIYKGWNGSAVKNSYRINATYSIPVG